MVIGIAVPSFAYRLSSSPGVTLGGHSSKVFKRGVVGGRVALLIRLEANSFMHIHQAELLQSQVCCGSAPVTLDGRVHV